MKKRSFLICTICSLLLASCGWLWDDAESDAEELGEAIGEGIACSIVTLGGNVTLTDNLNNLEEDFGDYSKDKSAAFVNEKGKTFNMTVTTDSSYYATKHGYEKYKDSVSKCNFFKISDESAVSGFKVHYLKIESDDGKTDIEFILNDTDNHKQTVEYNNDCDPSCTESSYFLNSEYSTITFKMNGETCHHISETRFLSKPDSNIVIPDQLLVVKSSNDPPPQEGKLGCDIARVVFSPKGTLLDIEFKDGSFIAEKDYKEAKDSTP